MPLPLLPIVVSLLGAAAYHQASRKKLEKGVLTPERQMIYDTAMKDVRDSEKLRNLAKTFREQGLPTHADMLEKRANLRDMPKHVKQERRDIFKMAMKSSNANAVRTLANAFEKQGAAGSAASLREYAASIPVKAATTAPIPIQPIPPSITVSGENVEESTQPTVESVDSTEDITEETASIDDAVTPTSEKTE